ncbi:hypothetical protein IAU59_001296 [Kwoniella sp. CBS 9459]
MISFFFPLAMVTHFLSLIVLSAITTFFFPSFGRTVPHIIESECDSTAGIGPYPVSVPVSSPCDDDDDDDDSVEGYHVPSIDYAHHQNQNRDQDRESQSREEVELDLESQVELCASRIPANLYGDAYLPLQAPLHPSSPSAVSIPAFSTMHAAVPSFVPLPAMIPIPILIPMIVLVPMSYHHPTWSNQVYRPAYPVPQCNILPLLQSLLSLHANEAIPPIPTTTRPRARHRVIQLLQSPTSSIGEHQREREIGRSLARVDHTRRARKRRKRRFHPYKRALAESDCQSASSTGDHRNQPCLSAVDAGPVLGFDKVNPPPSDRPAAVYHPASERAVLDSQPQTGSPQRKRRRGEQEITPPLESIAQGYSSYCPLGSASFNDDGCLDRRTKRAKVADPRIEAEKRRSLRNLASPLSNATLFQRRRSRPTDAGGGIETCASVQRPPSAACATPQEVLVGPARPSSAKGPRVVTNCRQIAVVTRRSPVLRVRSPRSPRLICSSAVTSSSSGQLQLRDQRATGRKRSRPRSLSPLEHAQRGQNKRRRLTKSEKLAIYRYKSPPGISGNGNSSSSHSTSHAAADSEATSQVLPTTPALTFSSGDGGDPVLITPTTEKMVITKPAQPVCLRAISYHGKKKKTLIWLVLTPSNQVSLATTPIKSASLSLTSTPGSMSHPSRKRAPDALTLTPHRPALSAAAGTSTGQLQGGLTSQERAELSSFVSQCPDGLVTPATTALAPRSPVSPASSKFPIASPPTSPISPTFPTSIRSRKPAKARGFGRPAATNGSRKAPESENGSVASSVMPMSSSGTTKAQRVSEHRLKKYRRTPLGVDRSSQLLYHLNMPQQNHTHSTEATDSLQSRRYDLIVQLLRALGMDRMPTALSTPSPKFKNLPLTSSTSDDASLSPPAPSNRHSSPLRPLLTAQAHAHESGRDKTTIEGTKKTFVNTSEPINVLARYLTVDHLSPRDRRRAMACLDAYAAWRDAVQSRVERKVDAAMALEASTNRKKKKKKNGSQEGAWREISGSGPDAEDDDDDGGGWYDLAVAHMEMTSTTNIDVTDDG